MTSILQEIGYRLPWATEFHHNTLFMTEGNYEYEVKAKASISFDSKFRIELSSNEIINGTNKTNNQWKFDVNWTDENYEIAEEVKRLIEEDLKERNKNNLTSYVK